MVIFFLKVERCRSSTFMEEADIAASVREAERVEERRIIGKCIDGYKRLN